MTFIRISSDSSDAKLLQTEDQVIKERDCSSTACSSRGLSASNDIEISEIALKALASNGSGARDMLAEQVGGSSAEKALLERKFPRPGLMDTVCGGERILDASGKLIGFRVIYAHESRELCFQDDEILSVHEPVSVEKIGSPIPDLEIQRNELGRIIIQQQALRGCSAAAAAMLAADRGVYISRYELQKCNLGTLESMGRLLRSSGLYVQVQNIASADIDAIQKLSNALQVAAVAIECLLPNLGGHIIVLDAVDDLSARIRDPYHGWDISVTREAFNKIAGKHWNILRLE